MFSRPTSIWALPISSTSSKAAGRASMSSLPIVAVNIDNEVQAGADGKPQQYPVNQFTQRSTLQCLLEDSRNLLLVDIRYLYAVAGLWHVPIQTVPSLEKRATMYAIGLAERSLLRRDSRIPGRER